ncbi:hypothetical protein [Cyclobacterium qasimii]|uniref:Lipoprotein n=2 Tax=Cyclobacterium qasimii TaxID=1350429 RepID=S7WWZ6_9BACT|nr:hypothetical protein [Cyclobacterium qasimii]EPR71284.1 hypothetical protein ADICYQ_0510 [Cyclobacterium qasimii M12-11B]GEO23794.1 hypothetical protein CQA01_43280 [Cyclobacterium qasimii]
MQKILLFLAVIITAISCKENKSTSQLVTINENTVTTVSKFPESVPTCEPNKKLFDAVPHLDTYAVYNFKDVGCTKRGLVAQYDHPTEEFYEFTFTINEEVNENKTMFNYLRVGYNGAVKLNIEDTYVSDLHIFDNAFMTTTSEAEYDEVKYNATYKDKYIIIITLRGKNLSSKAAIDSYVKNYLEAINKDFLD